MRPCCYELIKGLIYTWENDVFPIVSESGQGEVVRRMRGGSIVLRLLAASWDSEGAHAYYGNKELRQGLRRSLAALEKAGLSEAVGEVKEQLAKEYVAPGNYRDLNLLLKEADDLKAVLEQVLTAIAGVAKPGKPLVKAHDQLCKIIKVQVERDMDLDRIIRGDFSQVETTMNEFIQRLCP
jgi:hypothetical protein